MTEGESHFATLYRAAVLSFLAGWILAIGKGFILPIFAAVISIYVLNTAADAMGKFPLARRLPPAVRRSLVLVAFTLCIVGLGVVVARTVNDLVIGAPTYKANLEEMASKLAGVFRVESLPSWEEIRAATIAKIDLREMVSGILGSVTSFASGTFLVVVYAFFLGAERLSLADKLAAAFPLGDQTRTAGLIHDINSRIGDYLAIKSLINVVLGVASYLIMLLMGLDFAVFWAVLIALGNYIPYVGTLAVLFPIVFSIAQFGSLATSLILAALLALAQIVSDNVLEPKIMAKQLNLSPFVIVVALSLWSALWGLPGAILAIPLTSMLAIIFAAFPATRFLAVLMAERLDKDEGA